MKYKCINSFPGWEVGEETAENPRGFMVTDYPEYFQPIEEKKSVWELKEGDKYYYINCYCINPTEFDGGIQDIAILDSGNMFLTQQEAEQELNKRKALASIKKWIWEKGYEFEPDWSNKDQIKYNIAYDCEYEMFMSDGWSEVKFTYTIPYFSKEKHILELIKEKEPDLKILFNVE